MKIVIQQDHQGHWYAQNHDGSTGAFTEKLPQTVLISNLDRSLKWLLDEFKREVPLD